VSQVHARSGVAAALAAVIIWGLVPAGTRYFVLRLDPLSFNVIRYFCSGLGAVPFMLSARPWAWPSRDRWLLLLCALLAVPGYSIPVAIAARTLSASHTGLLIATEPVMIVLFSLWLQRRRVSARVLLGGAIALAGVALTSLATPAQLFGDWISTLQVLLGAASWSLYTVLTAQLVQRYGAFGVTGGVLVIGSIALIAGTAPLMPLTQWPSALTLVEVGSLGLFSSLLGFLLWNLAAGSLPADRLGLFLYLLPGVALLAGANLLSEALTWPLLLGGALIVLGVAIGERRWRAPGTSTSPQRCYGSPHESK
jgi:drug/metabolite transporter (DMT)-like permease